MMTKAFVVSFVNIWHCGLQLLLFGLAPEPQFGSWKMKGFNLIFMQGEVPLIIGFPLSVLTVQVSA